MTPTPQPAEAVAALTAESEALVADLRDGHDDQWAHDWLVEHVPGYDGLDLTPVCRAIEAAAVARHVRETGCEELREAAEELRRHYVVDPDSPYVHLESDCCGDAMEGLFAALAAPAASPEWTADDEARMRADIEGNVMSQVRDAASPEASDD